MGTGKQSVRLIHASSVVNPNGTFMRGGQYILSVECAGWNGASVAMKRLGADGVTQKDVKRVDGVTNMNLTADEVLDVNIGEGAVLIPVVTGAPSQPLYLVLAER